MGESDPRGNALVAVLLVAAAAVIAMPFPVGAWFLVAGNVDATADLSSPALAPNPQSQPPHTVGDAEIFVIRAAIERRLQQLSARLGVKVRYADHEEETLLNRDVLPFEAEALPTMLDNLEPELLRYPAPLRARVLREVVLTDTLWNGVTEPSGHAECGPKRIVIALKARAHVRRAPRIIHHEMAHLVYCAPAFPRRQWAAVSGDGLEMTPHEFIDAQYRGEADGIALPRGFVTKYAATNRREDFAETAEMLFTNPYKLEGMALDDPVIAHKRDLVMDHYHSLYDGFDFYPHD